MRLAQLEAENEALAMSSVGNEIRFDPSRAASIEESLRSLEDRIAAAAEEQKLQTATFPATAIPFSQRNAPAVDLNAMQNHLKGEKAAETTASK